MGRNFCNLKSDDYYSGAELGRRFEVRCDKEGIRHLSYYKGKMVRLLREAEVPCVDGMWLGKFAIPVMKAEFERLKSEPKNKKAKPVGKQTSQVSKNNTNNTNSNITHQISIEEVASELDTDAIFLEMLNNLFGTRVLEWYFQKRLKDLGKEE